MKRTASTATIPATEARTQLGEILDDVIDSSRVVAIERLDDPEILLIATDGDPGSPTENKHAEWIKSVRELRQRLAPYVTNFDEWERPEDIIRELRDR